ncbi:DUF4139 domain-containing protein [Parapedobacter tibetensis]|uniref:DUF4139 domain-containing protein n=1 Tax=Parapedobacter tibetensis TaxID=2972951 RepID=UPI00214D41EA|nr:mucoidy inhibitor MuiA family protein [Parapedobacter tibetensis]
MKKLLFFVFAGYMGNAVFAQSSPTVAKLDSAIVYRQGAELMHRARLRLNQGANTLRIAGIARSLDERSLRIDLPEGVSLLSVQQAAADADRMGALDDHPKYRQIADSVDRIKQELEEIRNQQLAEEGTLVLLDENQQLAGKEGALTIDQLKRFIDYYKQERLAVRGRIITLNAAKKRTQSQLDRLEKALKAVEASIGGSGSQLDLQLFAERDTDAPIAIRYVTTAAGWTAFYDLRVNDVASPLSLVYKAQVRQETGVDWKQVALTLATGSPARAGTAPQFDPWFLQVVPPTPRPLYASEADLAMENMELEEVATAQSKRSEYVAIPMQVQESQLNLRFHAPVPYDIAANGKPHGVILQQVDHPARYHYYAAPKFDLDAFLVAEVTDYRKLNLLAGEANLIVENAYVGRATVDPKQTGDTLRLSMGRDDRVAISRTRVDENRTVQRIGNQSKQTFTYEIMVQNHKSTPIDLTLEEPYPISADDAIRVKLLETSGATNDEEKGRLKWVLSLKPGESKAVRIEYEVRFPKDSAINL